MRLRFLLFLLILLRFLHLIFYRFSYVPLMIFPCTSSPFTILLLALYGIYGASCPCVDSTTLHHTHIQPSCLRYSLHHLSSYPPSFQTVNQVDCSLPGHCGFILLLPPVEIFVVRACKRRISSCERRLRGDTTDCILVAWELREESCVRGDNVEIGGWRGARFAR